MKTRVSTAAAAAFGLACVASAGADETSIRLKDGPELASVNAYCSICHSADYIEMNSRFHWNRGVAPFRDTLKG